MQLAASNGGGGSPVFAADRYVVLNGFLSGNVTTELNTQVACRNTTTTFKNLFCNVASNTTTAATIRLHQNGSSVISVAVGSGLTGFFEETATTHTPSATTDLYNYMVDITSGVSINISVIAIGHGVFSTPKSLVLWHRNYANTLLRR
jgi:hypothetical protein